MSSLQTEGPTGRICPIFMAVVVIYNKTSCVFFLSNRLGHHCLQATLEVNISLD